MMKQRTFTIYALLDPGDNLIRYVGITKDIETRFYGHTHDTPGNYEERRWVKNLKKIGMSPILEVLEVIEGAIVQVIAWEREHYWIREMLCRGHPLLNVSGVSRSYVPATVESYRIPQKPSLPHGSAQVITTKKPFTMADNDELLTVEEVARRLKVNQKRVYKLIQDGDLEATNIGGEGRNIYRISLADFNRYLQSRRVRRDE